MDRVRDWMTDVVVTVDPEASVASARELMWRTNIRHLPVVDGERLIGVVSDRDVSRAAAPDMATLSRAQPPGAGRPQHEVRTVMTTAVQTVWPRDTVVYAASVMAQWKIGALPVVDNDRLVGIITTTDCLRALVALHHSAPAQVTADE